MRRRAFSLMGMGGGEGGGGGEEWGEGIEMDGGDADRIGWWL